MDTVSCTITSSENNKKMQKKSNGSTYVLCIILLVISVFLMKNSLAEIANTIPAKRIKPTSIFLLSVTLFFIVLSYMYLLYIEKENTPQEEKLTIKRFFDLHLSGGTVLLVGLVQGFFFGMIDNGAMFLGLDSIENIVMNMGLDADWAAGLANAYSSIFGSLIGAVVSKAVSTGTGVTEAPWYMDMVGVVLGSIAGIPLAKSIKPSDPSPPDDVMEKMLRSYRAKEDEIYKYADENNVDPNVIERRIIEVDNYKQQAELSKRIGDMPY